MRRLLLLLLEGRRLQGTVARWFGDVEVGGGLCRWPEVNRSTLRWSIYAMESSDAIKR